jgi:hypothetical protein
MGLFDIFRKKKKETVEIKSKDAIALNNKEIAPHNLGKTMVMYNNNIGDSLENAVVIHGAANSGEGIIAENQYLSEKFGQRGLDWNKREQSLIGKENKHIDKIEIELKDGTNKTVYFDITEFFIIDDK